YVRRCSHCNKRCGDGRRWRADPRTVCGWLDGRRPVLLQLSGRCRVDGSRGVRARRRRRRGGIPDRLGIVHSTGGLVPMYRLLLILIAIGVPAVATAQTKVKVGTVRATVIGGVVSAQAQGYFKEVGI